MSNLGPVFGPFTAYAGGGKAYATPLSLGWNVVTVVVTAADSVILPPTINTSDVIVVDNQSANACQVYGSGIDTIDGVATGTGSSQAGNSVIQYSCRSVSVPGGFAPPTAAQAGKWVSSSNISGGAAGGDLTGSYPNPTIASIQGTTVSGVTGTGNAVLSTSPTLVTPALGTPASGVMTNMTGSPTLTIAKIASAHGALLQIQSIEEEVTLANSGFTDSTTNLLPANSIIYGVSCRVTGALLNARTWEAGVAGTVDAYASAGQAGTLGTATSSFSSGSVSPIPTVNASNTKIRLTLSNADGGNGTTTKIRVAVLYATLTALTS